MGLARRYRKEDVEAAFRDALLHGTTAAGYVRQILTRKHPTGHLGEIHREPPKGLSLGPVDPGSSAGYEVIFEEQKVRRKTDDRDSTT